MKRKPAKPVESPDEQSPKPRGRPKVPADKAKGNVVTFRLEAKEHERIQQAADASEMKLPAWIRSVLVRAANRILGSK